MSQSWTSGPLSQITSADGPVRNQRQWLGPSSLCALLSGAVASAFMLMPASAQAQPVTWSLRDVNGPSARTYHAMAYDSARATTVLFGGIANSGASGETWEWDGIEWALRANTGPSPRYYHAMAYDSARGVTTLFGGFTGADDGETWEWNGATWAQRSISGPVPRYGHAMAYDAGRGVTVLFGGSTGSLETWEWNGTTATWTQAPSGALPARVFHAMAYDSVRGAVVLFGGFSDGNYYSDTWERIGNTWAQRSLGGPPARSTCAMSYDDARGVTVLFGGWNGSTYLSDNWEWTGSGSGGWTQLLPAGPSPRQNTSMCYDTGRGVTVLFGGFNGLVVDGQTWERSDWPLVTLQPVSQRSCEHSTAVLSVVAAGTMPLSYAWRYNGEPIDTTANPSAATAILTLTSVGPADEASYDCIVTNAFGSVATDVATLTICPADFNCDGILSPDDLDEFITAFFSDAEQERATCDFNQDGIISPDDLDEFITAYFEAC